MKREINNKIQLGAFVSLGVLLFIAAIYLIGKKQQLFSSTFQISTEFRDVSGLQIGNNVRFAGINVGIIQNIEIVNDTTVKVDMLIEEDTRRFIKKNSRAVIGSDGLMGNKLLIITPGTNDAKAIQDKDKIQSTIPVSLDDIFMNLQITSDKAARLSSDLSDIIANIRMGKGTMGKLVMDSVFADNIDKAIINIRQGAGGFKQNMDAARSNILLKGYFKKKEDGVKEENIEKKKKD